MARKGERAHPRSKTEEGSATRLRVGAPNPRVGLDALIESVEQQWLGRELIRAARRGRPHEVRPTPELGTRPSGAAYSTEMAREGIEPPTRGYSVAARVLPMSSRESHRITWSSLGRRNIYPPSP